MYICTSTIKRIHVYTCTCTCTSIIERISTCTSTIEQCFVNTFNKCDLNTSEEG